MAMCQASSPAQRSPSPTNRALRRQAEASPGRRLRKFVALAEKGDIAGRTSPEYFVAGSCTRVDSSQRPALWLRLERRTAHDALLHQCGASPQWQPRPRRTKQRPDTPYQGIASPPQLPVARAASTQVAEGSAMPFASNRVATTGLALARELPLVRHRLTVRPRRGTTLRRTHRPKRQRTMRRPETRRRLAHSEPPQIDYRSLVARRRTLVR